jgi:hypothetical protein
MKKTRTRDSMNQANRVTTRRKGHRNQRAKNSMSYSIILGVVLGRGSADYFGLLWVLYQEQFAGVGGDALIHRVDFGRDAPAIGLLLLFRAEEEVDSCHSQQGNGKEATD